MYSTTSPVTFLTRVKPLRGDTGRVVTVRASAGTALEVGEDSEDATVVLVSLSTSESSLTLTEMVDAGALVVPFVKPGEGSEKPFWMVSMASRDDEASSVTSDVREEVFEFLRFLRTVLREKLVFEIKTCQGGAAMETYCERSCAAQAYSPWMPRKGRLWDGVGRV